MGPVRVVSAGLVVALMGVAACSDEPDRASDGSFCRLASSVHLERIDLTDPDVVAGARSDLSRLRALAPATISHDLTRLLEAGDVGPADDVDDLQAAAARLRHNLVVTCGATGGTG